MLNEEQLSELRNKLNINGCVNLKDYLTNSEFALLQSIASDLYSYPEIVGGPMKYFEHSECVNKELLNRIEYFLDLYDELKSLIEVRVIPLLVELTKNKYLLFKEKINFKMPGGGGFKAHQDAPAFKRFVRHEMLVVMIPIHETTLNNGCLHIANYFNQTEMPHIEGQIPDDHLREISWLPVQQKPKDLCIFSSYLIHKSGPNYTECPRSCYFLTFNLKELGSLRSNYFAYKRENFPPRIERSNNKKYNKWQKNLSRKIF